MGAFTARRKTERATLTGHVFLFFPKRKELAGKWYVGIPVTLNFWVEEQCLMETCKACSLESSNLLRLGWQ